MSTPARLPRMQMSDGPDEIFAALMHSGGVIVDGFIDRGQIERLNAELDPFDQRADPLMSNVYDFAFDASVDAGEPVTPRRFRPAAADAESFRSGNTRNVTGLTTKSPTFAHEILDHPLYMAMCDRLLKPHCANYVLNHSHLINVGPGALGQPLHRDEAVWERMPGLGVGSHLQMASVVALVDFTEANGATRVAPGSHLWEGDPRGTTGRVPLPEEVCQAVMPAGSAVLYTGWTFHGAGPNRTTDQQRRGLHVSYCQGWLRTEENNVLATPPEVARRLSPKKQELLGYGVHGALGMLELRSPIDQLRAGFI
jgi:hypothetical protein